MALTQTQVSQLYVTLFGRVSEGAGNKYWQSSQNMTAAADAMLATSAAAEYFGSALTSNEAFVKHIYKNTLNKTQVEDPAGIKFWVDALDAGNSRALIVSELIKAAVDPVNAGDAQNYFNNKVALSDYTAATVEGANLQVADLAPFVNALSYITSNASSVEDGKVYINALAGTGTDTSVEWNSTPVNPGTTVDLTVNTDILTANVFNAGMAFNPGGTDRMLTLQSEDVLTGDATRADNTLNVTFGKVNADEGDPATRTPVLKNIQNINVQVTGDINELDLRDANDVEKLNIDRITQEASNTFEFKSIGQKLDGMRVANVAKEDIEVKFEHKKGLLSGFEDKSNLELNNVNADSVVITSDATNAEGYEILNLTSKQNVSLNSLKLDQLRELTIKGSGDLSILDIDVDNAAAPQFNKLDIAGGIDPVNTRGFVKLDASGFAGKLTLDITDLVKNASDPFDSGKPLYTSIIGGGLGDTFYVGDNIGDRITIDGGAGADKLVLVGGTIGEYEDGKTATIKNIETLEMRAQAATGLTVDFDRFDESLKNVTVRNEFIGSSNDFTLNDISAKFANEGKIVIEHAVSQVSLSAPYPTVSETTVIANLKDNTGTNDTLSFEIVNAKNYDATFEYTIKAAGVENLKIADNDTESNTLYLDPATINSHTGTITLTGGTAGLYYAVDGEVVAKNIDAATQKSDLRLTVKDQKDASGENIGQDIKLGSGNDVLTFIELDGFDKKDVLTDNGGEDVIRALFSKNSTLNIKGIEGIHIAAKNNVELDITQSDITKVVIMSAEAVAQNDLVSSLGAGVKGMNSSDVDATKIITFKTSKIDTLNFSGDVDTNDKSDADEMKNQNFNGVTLEANASENLAININSALDNIFKGAESYTLDQITVHGTKNITVNVADESDVKTPVVTTIKNIYAKDLNTLTLNAQRDLNVGTVTANATNNGISLIDATKVLGDLTADVIGLGDSAKVKMSDGDNVFSALGSAGKLIEITAGNGDNTITGSAQSDFITAGNGNNNIKGDRGDNVIVVGDGYDTIETKDGNDTIDLGKGYDRYEDNIGTGLDATGATTTVTKEFGAANIQIAPNGTVATVDQWIAVGNGSSLKFQWEGDTLQEAGTVLDGAKAMTAGIGAITLDGTDKNDFWIVKDAALKEVKGGIGNDVAIVTDSGAALTFIGGAGNDAAVGGMETDHFTGGAGADVFVMQNKSTIDGKVDVVKIADGESVAGSHDVVYGFDIGAAAPTVPTEGNIIGIVGKDVLDLDYVFSAHTAVTNKAVTGYGAIADYSITTDGLVTFRDKDANALLIDEETLSNALSLLAKELNNTNKTVAFAYDQNNNDNVTDATDSTFVFQDGLADTVVELVGVTGVTGLGDHTTGNGVIAIA